MKKNMLTLFLIGMLITLPLTQAEPSKMNVNEQEYFLVNDIIDFGQAAWGMTSADFNDDGKMDFIFLSLFLPIGALLICIFLGYAWGVKNAVQEVFSGNPKFRLKSLWAFSVKFISPIAILIILYFIKTIAG